MLSSFFMFVFESFFIRQRLPQNSAYFISHPLASFTTFILACLPQEPTAHCVRSSLIVALCKHAHPVFLPPCRHLNDQGIVRSPSAKPYTENCTTLDANDTKNDTIISDTTRINTGVPVYIMSNEQKISIRHLPRNMTEAKHTLKCQKSSFGPIILADEKHSPPHATIIPSARHNADGF